MKLIEKQIAEKFGITVREYRRMKRKQFNELLRFTYNFRLGMAALPEYEKIGKAFEILEKECAPKLREYWKNS